MSSDNDNSLGIGLIMLGIAAPLLAPEFFIVVGLLAWSIFYVLIWLTSWGADFSHGIPHLVHWGFDSTESLPSTYGVQNINGSIWLTLIVASVGLLRGIRGALAMVCVWAPMFFIGPFDAVIGASVEQDKDSYIESNYIKQSCKSAQISPTQAANYCLFVPKLGKKLPYFIQDTFNSSSSPEKVIPYYEFNKHEQRLNNIESTQLATQVKTDNDLSFPTWLKNHLAEHYIQTGILVVSIIIALLT